MNEADTCRKFVVPKLQAAGWDNEPHSIAEQRTITDGRIVPVGKGFVRKSPKRADYILRYERNFPLAVVEAKADWQTAGEGIQQAKDYAELLQLKFAYATNGEEIVEFDYSTGKETIIQSYPTTAELWARYAADKQISGKAEAQMLTPMNHLSGKGERYYQEIAINCAVEGILTGQRRQLLTMATGAGKTAVAFQICWKLWNAMWNRTQTADTGRARHSVRAASESNDLAGQERRARSDTPYPEADTLSASTGERDGVRCRTHEHRKPKILFLADRNILVDDPMGKDFTPFGDARWKLEGGVVNKGREMYFAIYQSLAKDERRPGLYQEFPRDFFDLIIVDECHRGSARDDSNWREILNYFEPAYQLGMTATPLREENRDTYLYFGNPIYTYSLRQGIDDGFLAPYRVHRIISEWDAAGWRPSKDELEGWEGRTPVTGGNQLAA